MITITHMSELDRILSDKIIREFVILNGSVSFNAAQKLSSRSGMKTKFLAGRVLRKRVCGCVVAEMCGLGMLALEPSFSLSSFPQVYTASLRGRTRLQCDTKPETSEGSRRKA